MRAAPTPRHALRLDPKAPVARTGSMVTRHKPPRRPLPTSPTMLRIWGRSRWKGLNTPLHRRGQMSRFRASLSGPPVFRVRPALERWLSGRKHRTRNAAYLEGYRGFESHPLRHCLHPSHWRDLSKSLSGSIGPIAPSSLVEGDQAMTAASPLNGNTDHARPTHSRDHLQDPGPRSVH